MCIPEQLGDETLRYFKIIQLFSQSCISVESDLPFETAESRHSSEIQSKMQDLPTFSISIPHFLKVFPPFSPNPTIPHPHAWLKPPAARTEMRMAMVTKSRSRRSSSLACSRAMGQSRSAASTTSPVRRGEKRGINAMAIWGYNGIRYDTPLWGYNMV